MTAPNEDRRTGFPNMTSLVRYGLWNEGVVRVARFPIGGIVTAKARSALNRLVDQCLATVTEEGDLLVFYPIPGTRLDRTAFPEPPDDVDASP